MPALDGPVPTLLEGEALATWMELSEEEQLSRLQCCEGKNDREDGTGKLCVNGRISQAQTSIGRSTIVVPETIIIAMP